MDVIELGRRAIDMKLENIGAIVMAGEVVPKFHLNSEFKIAIGVKNPFFRSHWPRNYSTHRIDD